MTAMVKQIHVACLPELLPSRWSQTSTTAVVIDTLRFTSTACVALKAGADRIYAVSDVDNARKLASSLGPNSRLCGERHCHPIDGFHFGNSPLEYTKERVTGHQLVFSTTNGTRAVEAASEASAVALASLLNRSAISKWLLGNSCATIWIICAGTDGEIALEDVLTAGAILNGCLNLGSSLNRDCQLANDSSHLALQLFRSATAGGETSANALRAIFSRAAGGINLVNAGYEKDLAEVAQLDLIPDVIPLRVQGPTQPYFANCAMESLT